MDEQDDDRVAKWMLNPHCVVIRCNNDEILIRHSKRSLFSDIVRDVGASGVLADVVELLSEAKTIPDIQGLVEVNEADLTHLLGYLESRGVVVRIDQTISVADFYTRLLKGRRLADSTGSVTIGIVGGGVLGTRIAMHIAEFGFSEIIQLSGVSVQSPEEYSALRLSPQLETPAVNSAHALKNHLIERGFDGSYTPVEGDEHDVDQIRSVFARSDFCIVALDHFSPDALHTSNDVAIDQGRRWLFVYLDGSEIAMGPVFVPGETPCYLELSIQQDAALNYRGQSWLYNEKLNSNGRGAREAPAHELVSPRVGISAHVDIASGFASSEILNLFASGTSALLGRTLHISLEDLGFEHANVMTLPRCPACSRLRGPYRSTFY